MKIILILTLSLILIISAQPAWVFTSPLGAYPSDNGYRITPALTKTNPHNWILHGGAYNAINNLWFEDTYEITALKTSELYYSYHQSNYFSRPPKRLGGSLVWNIRLNTTFLFGGEVRDQSYSDCNTCNCCTYSDDIWSLNITHTEPVWVNLLNITEKPPGRADHTAIHDGFTQQMIIFGGRSNSLVYGDLWIFDYNNNNWTQILDDENSPSPRYGHSSMFWGNDVYIFAGTNGVEYFNDMYKFNLDDMTWSTVNYTMDSTYGSLTFEPRAFMSVMMKGGTNQSLFLGGESSELFSCPTCVHLFNASTNTFTLYAANGDFPVNKTYGLVSPLGLWIVGINGTYHYNDTGYCGDGKVSIFEDCDDKYNKINCKNCVLEYCGDGIINGNENCDSGPHCPRDCKCLPKFHKPDNLGGCEVVCGNGIIDSGEECDPEISEFCSEYCHCIPPTFSDGLGNCIDTISTIDIIVSAVFASLIVVFFIATLIGSLYVQFRKE